MTLPTSARKHMYICIKEEIFRSLRFGFFVFNGISTYTGYLMPNLFS